MYRIGICDDEASVCGELEGMVLAIGSELGINLFVEAWSTGEAMLHYFEQGDSLDLLFLDIELPGINGIDAGKLVRNMGSHHMQIAYISSKKDYVMELFQNRPIGFLVKPIRKEEVLRTVKMSYCLFEEGKYCFEYSKAHDDYVLECDSIVYFTSERKKITAVMNNGERHEFYGKLAEASARLPGYFSTIHKSCIINRNYVERYSYEEVRMANGDPLIISKTNRSKIRSQVEADRKRRMSWHGHK